MVDKVFALSFFPSCMYISFVWWHYSEFPHVLENLEKGWPIFQSWKTWKIRKKAKCPGNAQVFLWKLFLLPLLLPALSESKQVKKLPIRSSVVTLSSAGNIEAQCTMWHYQPIKFACHLRAACYPVLPVDFVARLGGLSDPIQDFRPRDKYSDFELKSVARIVPWHRLCGSQVWGFSLLQPQTPLSVLCWVTAKSK